MKYLHHSDADFKYKSYHMLAKNEVKEAHLCLTRGNNINI